MPFIRQLTSTEKVILPFTTQLSGPRQQDELSRSCNYTRT